MPTKLYRCVIKWAMHGGIYSNRVGVLGEGADVLGTEALSGLAVAVIPSMLAAISEQVELYSISVTPLNVPTDQPETWVFENVQGERSGPAYTTHDQYKIRLRSATRLFKTGGKLVMGCAEGDVTDSAVDTDMPALLDAIAKAFTTNWDGAAAYYRPVLFRPDKQVAPWEFDYIVEGAYAHVGTAGMRKKFRQRAYTGDAFVTRVFTSGNGSWADLNQDPGSLVTLLPVGNIGAHPWSPAGTLNADGSVTGAF